jgi:hypothetical protein
MITCLFLAYDKTGYFSVNIIFSRQSPVLPDFQPKFGTLFVFSFSSFVKAKFGAFVGIFI